MSRLIFANNAKSTLPAPITNVATSFSVSPGDGALFPSPVAASGEYFKVTIEGGGLREIMHCTARSGDTLTVVRAQESTTGQAFSTGATVSNRATRDTFQQLIDFPISPIVAIDIPFANVTSRMTRTAKYVFGTGAVTDGGVANGVPSIPITAASGLSTYFNPTEDKGGTVVIQGLIARWAQFSATANYVMNASDLALTCTQTGYGTCSLDKQPVGGTHADGTTNNPWASYPNITPANVTVGQICALMFTNGLFYVSFNDGTNFKLTPLPNVGNQTGLANCGIAFPPYYYAALTVAGSGSSPLTFAAVPSGVAAGQIAYQWATSPNQITWSGISTVQSKTATTVTLDNPNGLGSMGIGTGIIFIPATYSGQLWTKSYQMAGLGGVKALACEATFKVPAMNGFVSGYTDPTTVPTTAPNGAFPAFWMYAGNDGGTFFDTSEIDNVEMQIAESIDFRTWTGANHGPGAQANAALIRNPTNGTWTNLGGTPYYYHLTSGSFDTAFHKYQMLYLDSGMIYRFIDGTLIQSDRYNWTGGQRAQIGLSMQFGSLQDIYAALFMFPLNNANLPAALNVQDISIWTQ